MFSLVLISRGLPATLLPFCQSRSHIICLGNDLCMFEVTCPSFTSLSVFVFASNLFLFTINIIQVDMGAQVFGISNIF